MINISSRENPTKRNFRHAELQSTEPRSQALLSPHPKERGKGQIAVTTIFWKTGENRFEGALANRANLGEPTFRTRWSFYMLDRVTRPPGGPCRLARGTLLSELSFFCQVNSSCQVSGLPEMRSPQKSGGVKLPFLVITYQWTLPFSSDSAQLIECKIITRDTEGRLLAKRLMIK